MFGTARASDCIPTNSRSRDSASRFTLSILHIDPGTQSTNRCRRMRSAGIGPSQTLVHGFPPRRERQRNFAGVIVNFGVVNRPIIGVDRGPESKQWRRSLLYLEPARDGCTRPHRDKLFTRVICGDTRFLFDKTVERLTKILET